MSGKASHDTDRGPDPWLPGWDGALYAENTTHHRAHDQPFLDALSLAPPTGSSTSVAAAAT